MRISFQIGNQFLRRFSFFSGLKGRRGRKAPRRGSPGYSLIELLVVLAIIGLIVGLVGPRVLGYLETSKVKSARLQIDNFARRSICTTSMQAAIPIRLKASTRSSASRQPSRIGPAPTSKAKSSLPTHGASSIIIAPRASMGSTTSTLMAPMAEKAARATTPTLRAGTQAQRRPRTNSGPPCRCSPIKR